MIDSAETAPMYLDEVRLVRRLQSQDERAWEDALEHYAPQLLFDIRTSLKKRGLPPELADDIQQETWLTAVQKIGEFVCDGEGRLYHWLRAIAFNHVRNYNRKQRSTFSFDEMESDEENTLSLDRFLFTYILVGDSPEDVLLLKEQLSLLDRALQRLKPYEREILLRRLMWGEKPEELTLSYPALKPRSISQLVLRAKKTIQSALDEE
jgi:RNA polymerase sigma factor (sigma-70 family)